MSNDKHNITCTVTKTYTITPEKLKELLAKNLGLTENDSFVIDFKVGIQYSGRYDDNGRYAFEKAVVTVTETNSEKK